jgi:hypothetical protein
MAKWPDDAVYDTHAYRGIEPGTGYSSGFGIQAVPNRMSHMVGEMQSSCRDVPHRRVMNAVPLWVIQHSDAPMMSVFGEVDEIAAEVPKTREDAFPSAPASRVCPTTSATRIAASLRISPGTNYNPRYARNKRIQASVYFSWPLAAKCWPS